MNGFRRMAATAVLLASAGLGCTSKPGLVPVGGVIALPFIENDYAQAIADARKSNLPVFVEVWAPW